MTLPSAILTNYHKLSVEGLESLKALVGKLITGFTAFGNYLLGGAGAVIVIMLIWGGWQYIQGNAEAAKKTLIAAIIGAVIIAVASTTIELIKYFGGF